MLVKAAIRLSRATQRTAGRIWGHLSLRAYRVDTGKNLILDGAPLIACADGASITIGSNVVILNRSTSNPAGVLHRTILAASQPGARIEIGDGVNISGAIINAWKSIKILDGAMLGTGATIYDTDFHPTSPVRRHDPPTPSNTNTAPVVIGRNVWIGAHATILKGVTVGENAIVGLGAVVTRDVPPGAVVAGVPAKRIGWVDGYPQDHSLERGP